MLHKETCAGTMEPANTDSPTMQCERASDLEAESLSVKVKAYVACVLTRKSLSGLKSASNMATKSKSCSLFKPCKHSPVQPVTLRQNSTSQQVPKSAKQMRRHTMIVASQL